MTRPNPYLARMAGVRRSSSPPASRCSRRRSCRIFLGNPAVNGVIVAHPARRHRLYFPPGDRCSIPRSPGSRDSAATRATSRPRTCRACCRRWRRCSAAGRGGQRVALARYRCGPCSTASPSRLDETRETSRYLIGLLVFLGLLGTFYGLLETVQSVKGVIGGLSLGGSDVAAAFADLQVAARDAAWAA